MTSGCYTVEHTFDLNDLGEHYGFAQGTVQENEFGHVEAKVTKAVAHLISRDGKVHLDMDVTAFIDNPTRTNLEEALERKHEVAKARGA